MAYSTSNPPVCLMPSFTELGGASIWTYRSADAGSAVDADGYFTNAQDLGMKQGDVVFVTDSDTEATTTHMVIAINADGSADLGDGTAVGSATNTD